jgi:hypothetical protein
MDLSFAHGALMYFYDVQYESGGSDVVSSIYPPDNFPENGCHWFDLYEWAAGELVDRKERIRINFDLSFRVLHIKEEFCKLKTQQESPTK